VFKHAFSVPIELSIQRVCDSQAIPDSNMPVEPTFTVGTAESAGSTSRSRYLRQRLCDFDFYISRHDY
jgi:hypothetical protein